MSKICSECNKNPATIKLTLGGYSDIRSISTVCWCKSCVDDAWKKFKGAVSLGHAHWAMEPYEDN